MGTNPKPVPDGIKVGLKVGAAYIGIEVSYAALRLIAQILCWLVLLSTGATPMV